MKKVIILPLDGYPYGAILLEKLEKLITEPGMSDLIAYIKINDGAHNDDIGEPAMVAEIGEALRAAGSDALIFLDLKVFDVSATLVNVLTKYLPQAPGILTVSSGCSVEGVVKLRKLLPNTKLAMISVPTDISEAECRARFGMSPGTKIYNDLENIRQIYQDQTQGLENWDKPEPFDLVVTSKHELPFLDKNLPVHYGFIVPGIRDPWMLKKDEHQKRTSGILEVLTSVKNREVLAVMGAQLTKGNLELDISPEESRRLTLAEIQKVPRVLSLKDDPLSVLKNFGGYYKSPVDSDGRFVGPLVAYAGTYSTESGLKNKVGFEYFNFAQVETNSQVRRYFAELIAAKIKESGLQVDVVLGAPMGGLLLAGELGSVLSCRTIFAEKKVTALADPAKGTKEASLPIIKRHEIRPGEQVFIIEDVCNNFSTTNKLENLIINEGGVLAGIVCAFNRSGQSDWRGVPVVAAHYIPTEQFQQDDPAVAALIEQGKVVWDGKAEWAKLLASMSSEITT